MKISGYKFAKFETKDYVSCGVFGALIAAIMLFTLPFVQIFGFGMAFINSIQISLITAICILKVRKFGTGILVWTVFTVIMLPLPLFGPPGIHKPLLGVSLGFIIDVIYYLLKKYPRIGISAANGAALFATAWVLYIVVVVMGLPSEAIGKLTLMISIVNIFLAVGGSLVGIGLYKKIMRRESMQQLM